MNYFQEPSQISNGVNRKGIIKNSLAAVWLYVAQGRFCDIYLWRILIAGPF